MTGLLTDETEKKIAEKMHVLGYGSPDAVVLEALRVLDKKERLEVLRQEIQKGLDSETSTVFDKEVAQRIKARGRKRLAGQSH